jgi:spermidine synthase
MSISYQHPKVKVHVGDGFKFLDDYKNEFDVIITDSSDPEGPAESLFQKPYFELLFGALKEGGVITTQGCTSPTFAWFSCILSTTCLWFFLFLLILGGCSNTLFALQSSLSTQEQTRLICCSAENQWLHLPLITKLKKDCKEVFPTVEYAYTTIPTYPSGQIGFMVCCKDANRDVSKPLRKWTPEEEDKLCRYYNAKIHEASFILPTFARVALQ